jgi:hypothetical protein
MLHSTKTRALLAAGAALVAAGTFATALGQEAGSGSTPTVLSDDMTLGETATTTTAPPTALATPVASPGLKADVPCGFTSAC